MIALVLQDPGDRTIITGLTLAERGRRVAAKAGADRVVDVGSPEDLARARAAASAGEPVLVLDARRQVVAAPLLEPLRLDEPGTRAAFDAAGFAGAVVADGSRTTELWETLAADLAGGAATFAERSGVGRVTVGRRARHLAGTPAQRREADAWQFELVNKPLDAFLTVYFYRPLARPLTRLFLRSPFTPNQITVISTALSLIGCVIAAGEGYGAHVLGMALLVLGGIIDCNDGEVARLRLEGSKLGGWLDAIGDDLARIALLVGVGMHVAQRQPGLPIGWITGASLVLTLAAMLLIYWYCIFVIHSSNNQDYTSVLGVGPGQGETGGRRSLGRLLGDWGAQAARRDFIDLAALGLALVGLPEVTFAGLALGAVIGIVVVLPTHLKIVRNRRMAQSQA